MDMTVQSAEQVRNDLFEDSRGQGADPALLTSVRDDDRSRRIGRRADADGSGLAGRGEDVLVLDERLETKVAAEPFEVRADDTWRQVGRQIGFP